MNDIFDNKILCKKCGIEMKPIELIKNGFKMRAIKCPKCGERIIHPSDMKDFNQFNNLKHKTFKVKLRLVGNSYAVSIPREIVDFMHEQEKLMNDMVKLAFEDAKKLSLKFDETDDEEN